MDTDDLGFAEGCGFGFAEGAEFASAAVNHFRRKLGIECGGFGAGARGIRENVEVGERERIDEAQSGFVIGLGFAGEASDNVGSDSGVGKEFANEDYTTRVMFGAIPTVHGGENVVRTGLQGHMEVLGDAIGAGKERDEILGDVERLDGTDAKTRERRFVQDTTQEIEDVRARGKIAAPGAEVDAAENDLLKAGVAKAIDFGENGFWGKAAAFSADEWDDAERAAVVATILNFENGAGVIPFSTEDGGDEDVAGIKNVADEKAWSLG